MTIEDVKAEEADMLTLPGGMPGTKNLKQCQALLGLLQRQYENDKYIAAICAAPSILGYLGFLEGKKACVFPGMEETLTGAEVEYNEVSVDGKIITSRGMGCAVAFGGAIVEASCSSLYFI